MKKNVLALSACVAALSLAACNNETTSEPGTTVTPTVAAEATNVPEPTATLAPTATPTPEIDWYQEMLERSVMSTGNNARLKKVLEKARNGETVNIVTLGGSITEGANASPIEKGYAYLFAEAFGKTYGVNDGENINYVNAGLGGTPSALGVLRYERDVLAALGGEPDLFLIEFEVNDYAEVTKGRAYESLVYDVLSQNNNAAVIMVFAVRNDMWNVQNEHEPIAKHYDIPVVCIKDAVSPALYKNYFTKEEFFSDEYHPTNYGHAIMCDCIMQLIATVDTEEAEEMNAIPEQPNKGRDFVGTKMIDSATEGISIEKGAFTKVDTVVQPVRGSASFPNNWMHDAEAGNESFQMTLTCKNLLMNYKTGGNEFGSADVYVDGNLVMTLNGLGGWNGSNVVLLLDEKEAAEHTIEIKMAEGQENKAFTVYAFGYTE